MMVFVHTDFLDDIESNLEIKKEPGSNQEISEIRTAEIEIKEEFVELVAKENEKFPTQKTDLALVQHKIKKPNESNLPLKEFKQDCNQSNSVVKLNSQGLLESDSNEIIAAKHFVNPDKIVIKLLKTEVKDEPLSFHTCCQKCIEFGL